VWGLLATVRVGFEELSRQGLSNRYASVVGPEKLVWNEIT
jgi:hypothetical protein